VAKGDVADCVNSHQTSYCEDNLLLVQHFYGAFQHFFNEKTACPMHMVCMTLYCVKIQNEI